MNQNYFQIHKENEGMKNQIENLKVQLHAAVYRKSSKDLAAEIKQKEQEVILITSERDGLQGMIANATQHMASQLDQFRALAWDQELKSPPSFSLFRAYELQRDVLLRTLDLPPYSQLDSSLFDLVWKNTKPQANQHNLVCEMIARGDFVLMDPEKLILPIGNLGTRVTMYYINLEEQLHFKRQNDYSTEEHQKVRLPELGPILAAVPDRPPEQLKEWRAVLEKLKQFFMNRDTLKVKWTYAYQREELAQCGELSTGQYIRASNLTCKQITHNLSQLDLNLFDLGVLKEQVSFLQPLPFAPIPDWLKLVYPVGGSILNQRFLGHYDCLLDRDSSVPLPTWQGITWLLEDYELSRNEEKSWDLVYRRLYDSTWSIDAPTAIKSNGHFCNCPRRFLWAPDALIDSMEYNWSKIPGQFDTAAHCAVAYLAFFQVHKDHTDLVSFRAAVFCKFLHYMCSRFNVIVNVNIWDSKQPEFLLNLKLQYHNTQWVRMIEVMAMCHFLYGAHAGFVNELNGTKKVEIDKWLRSQRTNSSTLLADQDVRRAVERMEALWIRQDTRHADNHRNQSRGLRQY
jgi:hypothetical protein